MSRHFAFSFLAPLFALLIAVLAGCGAESSGKPAAPQPRAHLVELALAEPGRLSYSADRAGSLRALREVMIVNQEEGQLTELRVREKKETPGKRTVELDHRRNMQLTAKGFVSQDAVSRAATNLEIARAEARLLQARVNHMTIAAPFDGVVAKRLVEPGNVTPQHTHLLTVIDPSRLVTDVNVSELVLPYLSVGGPAQVRIDALGEALHPGKIVRIHPTIDPATRTGRIEVVLNPVPQGARPGQFSRVLLSTGSREWVVVPLAALQRDAQGEFVYVHQDDGTVRRAGIASGLRLADRVEIRDGLARGAKVVVKGFLGLAPGQSVKPVEPRAAKDS